MRVLSRIRVRLDDLLAEAGQRRFEIGQERRHWQRKAARAPRDALLDGRARVGAGLRQRTGTAEDQLHLRRIAAGLLGRAAHDVEQRHGVDLGTDRGEEAVAEAAGAAGGRFRVATDDDRHRFRDRLRIAADMIEFHELAREAGTVAGPQCAHGRDILVGALAATLEGNAERLELLLQPAYADAELDPAAAEIVERGDLLGQHQRVALRQDNHGRHEAQPRGCSGDPCQPDQRIGQFRRWTAWQSAARRIGIDALVVVGKHDVLDSEHRIETGPLRQAHQTARPFRIEERVVAKVQGEFHDGGSFLDRAARSIVAFQTLSWHAARLSGTRRSWQLPGKRRYLFKRGAPSYPRATEDNDDEAWSDNRYSGAHLDVPAALGQRAEELGYDSVWSVRRRASANATAPGRTAARIRLASDRASPRPSK